MEQPRVKFQHHLPSGLPVTRADPARVEFGALPPQAGGGLSWPPGETWVGGSLFVESSPWITRLWLCHSEDMPSQQCGGGGSSAQG